MIDFRRCEYLTGAAQMRHCPPGAPAEVAFAGRSNAGKSSALNAITDQRSLARTSKTPGRTQLIHFFELVDGGRLVDLPGYGYAKVPLKVKQEWGRMIENYLSKRDCLRGVVLMMDVRHPLTPFDEQMLDWCMQAELPCHILLTKADKLSKGAAQSTLLKVKKALHPDAPISIQLFSAPKKTGVDAARELLSDWLESGQAALLDNN